MGTFMGSKSPNDILNQWWATGIPLGAPGGASGSDTLNLTAQTTPVLAAVTIAVAATEYSYGLPTNCRSVQFQCRSEYDVRYAFASGKVASGVDPYWTLKAGDVYYKENLKTTAATLCFGANSAVLKVEIETWT